MSCAEGAGVALEGPAHFSGGTEVRFFQGPLLHTTCRSAFSTHLVI